LTWYFFTPPIFSFVLSPDDKVRLTLFFVSGMIVAYGTSRYARWQCTSQTEYEHYRRHT
jgi:hypothetical protein